MINGYTLRAPTTDPNLLTDCYRNCAKQAETGHHPPTRRLAKPQLRYHFPPPDNTRNTANEGFRSWCRKTCRFKSCRPHKLVTRGTPVLTLRRQGRLPLVGAGDVVPVRVDAALCAAVEERADDDHTPTSDVIRDRSAATSRSPECPSPNYARQTHA